MMARTVSSRGFVVVTAALVAAAALYGLSGSASDTMDKQAMKSRFLVVTHHTREQCLADLDAVVAASPALLERIEWGCMGGDHSGYLIVEAASAQAARDMLPQSLRGAAQVIQLNRFTAEQIRSFHKS